MTAKLGDKKTRNKPRAYYRLILFRKSQIPISDQTMMQYREKLTPKQFNLIKACVTDWKNNQLTSDQAMIIISHTISVDRPISPKVLKEIQQLAQQDQQDEERIKMKE
jgi:hypothetical protein